MATKTITCITHPESGLTKYKAIIRENNQYLAAKTTPTREEAEAWAKHYLDVYNGDLDARASGGLNLTFKQLAEEFLEQYSKKDPCTPRRVRWWMKRIGSKRLVEIDRALIRQILKTYEQGTGRRYHGKGSDGKAKYASTGKKIAPATVNRVRSVLSAVFKYANEEGYYSENPTKDIASRTENNKRTRYLDDGKHGSRETERLLEACKQSNWPKLHLFVLMLIETGARASELLGLSWTDVNFDDNIAHLDDSKNGLPKTLTFTDLTRNELLKFREIGSHLIFPSCTDRSKPMSYYRYWRKALKRAGVQSLRLHDLRHTCGSWLAANGADFIEIQAKLGHKSPASTMRYVHLNSKRVSKVTNDVMSKRLGKIK